MVEEEYSPWVHSLVEEWKVEEEGQPTYKEVNIRRSIDTSLLDTDVVYRIYIDRKDR